MLLHLIERLLGRERMWKISRRLYHHARREGSLDIAVNGEAMLQAMLARRSASEGRPLTVVDVGANYGQWSLSLLDAVARAQAPRPTLLLFEPVPAIREALAAKLVDADAAWSIEHIALSDAPGSGTMLVQDVAAGTHHLAAADFSYGGVELPVVIDTLDRVWKGGPIDIVKIDAEGFDPKVIAGMEGLLARGEVGVVQFEYGVLFVRSRSYLLDVFKLAQRTGYVFGILHGCGIETLAAWHEDLERFTPATMLLLHQRMADALGAVPVRYTASNTRVAV